MRSLFLLFIRNGGFITFALAELFCFYIIVRFNEQRGAIYDHTAHLLSARIQNTERDVLRYSNLRETADSLQIINAELMARWANAKTVSIPRWDTVYAINIDSLQHKFHRPQFRVIPAAVIGNSVSGSSNWITLNRGQADGVEPNAGVISHKGIVGIVRYVGDHYSLAMSLLHPLVKVSAELSKQGYFGSLSWRGGDPGYATLNDIPKHLTPQEGDTVITSGYSLMFPKGHMVGTISKVDLPAGENFYSIEVKLSHHMAQVSDVFIVNNLDQKEIEILQGKANNER